jgi:hypothetical protein
MCHLPTHSKASFIEAISVHIDDEKNRTVVQYRLRTEEVGHGPKRMMGGYFNQ